MNILFHTLGCKVNQYETEAMREALITLGHTNDKLLPIDAIIINSCTVTAESDRKTRQLVRRCRREHPNAIIALTGCMVQAFPDDANNLTEADIVIGNRDVTKIVDAINNYQNTRVFSVVDHQNGDIYNTIGLSHFNERTRAFMKIEDGCDRFCTYCIIPFARGRVRSRSVSDIKEEAKRLAKNGYSEIVLVGINLTSYGKGEDFNLCDAVDAVCEVKGIKRVRLGSLEPDHITDEMLNRFKIQPKFCPQFHLSLQSGCDETLKRMNRHYDSAFYEDLVNRIRKTFTNAAITTDIMVGFAGETDDEFNQSLNFVKKIGFARAHIFAYSRRSGTVAAGLKSQVSNADKQKRAHIMAEATRQTEIKFLKSQVGNVYPVLFETQENVVAEGYTPNYTRVVVKSEKVLTGQILDVLITSTKDDYCIGELI
ncbi:MAG: tRNA (N(6)-L-threonylcarbamoyladenosine(37)-C(2))-methylthiotransferase MtaB [Ruminococcaceae bacterium]|nr:tRNA (N(6)-L-threonylcarbamoyladenosine(37)-C(2))-methylthiotransferase MtaB [Oscillospiraceae bacterium]